MYVIDHGLSAASRRQVEEAYAHTRWVGSAQPHMDAAALAATGTHVAIGAGDAGTEAGDSRGDSLGDSRGDSLGDSREVIESDEMDGRLTKFALNKQKVALPTYYGCISTYNGSTMAKEKVAILTMAYSYMHMHVVHVTSHIML